jgi:hypothetical protein
MKPVHEWDEEYVFSLPLGEFDWLEVKGRRALDLTLPNVRENHVLGILSRVVSALANSGGGVLIYGLKDPDPADGGWLIDDGGVSTSIKGNTREWLETIIPNSVDLPLADFNVYSLLSAKSTSIQSGRALYLIDIPDSALAPHQATDNKYYIRVGGRSRPIGHRIVVDIMGRRQHPKVELEFKIEVATRLERDVIGDMVSMGSRRRQPAVHTECTLVVTATNTGQVYAQYVNCFIYLPGSLLDQLMLDRIEYNRGNVPEFYEYCTKNTVRDVVDTEFSLGAAIDKYGPARFDPVLPGLSRIWSLPINSNFLSMDLDNLVIKWSTYADNAPPINDTIAVKEIEVVDLREV